MRPTACLLRFLLTASLGATALAAAAADAPAATPPASEPVITPELDRRDISVPHIPSNNFEAGVFTGAYNAENFGVSLVGGIRLGYHINEDIFVEGVYGQTKVSDSSFRDILPGGIFPQPTQVLRYYDLSAGYNLFPGEIFLGRTHAKVSTLYIVAGIGNTNFDNTNHLTFNAGTGFRVFLKDWVAVQIDVRDHLYSIDLLGTRKDTNNLETTAGVTFFF